MNEEPLTSGFDAGLDRRLEEAIGRIPSPRRSLRAARERIVAGMLWTFTVLGAVAYAASVPIWIEVGQRRLIALYTAVYLWVLFVTLVRRSISYPVQAGSLLAMLFLVGASSVFAFGLAGSGHLWFVALAVIASLLGGLTVGLVALGLSLLLILGVGWLTASGLHILVVSPDFSTFREWAVVSSYFVLVGTILIIPLALLVRRIEIGLEKEHSLAVQLANAYRRVESAYDRTLVSLMTALDARDRETEGHSRRVADIAVAIGRELGLDDEDLKNLERGGLLHDIGKIGVSDLILHKPEELEAGEWDRMREHPEIGARIVGDIGFLSGAVPVIRHHHERWDGSGYPEGLEGAEIPLLARVFAVADTFDAMTSSRPYRQAQSSEAAVRFLERKAGELFDPEVVSALKRVTETRRLAS